MEMEIYFSDANIIDMTVNDLASVNLIVNYLLQSSKFYFNMIIYYIKCSSISMLKNQT